MNLIRNAVGVKEILSIQSPFKLIYLIISETSRNLLSIKPINHPVLFVFYLGHLKKANSFRLLHKQKEKLLFLYPHLEFQKWKILMNPKKLNRFRNIFSQIHELSKLLGNTPFLFQIGKYYQLIAFSKELNKQEIFQKFILRYGKVRRFGNVCYEGFKIQLLLKFISCLKSGKINVVHEKIRIFELVR